MSSWNKEISFKEQIMKDYFLRAYATTPALKMLCSHAMTILLGTSSYTVITLSTALLSRLLSGSSYSQSLPSQARVHASAVVHRSYNHMA